LAFVSDKGVPYKPTVELAPYQRVPKPPGRRDGREGTLEQEAEYLSFVESLSAPAPPKPSTEAINAAAAESKRTLQGGGGEVYETPLMAFLKARSEARAKQRSAGKAARQRAKADSAQAGGGAQPRVKKGAKSGTRSVGAAAGADGGDAGGRGERGARSKGMKTAKGERTAGPSTHVVISPSAAGVVSSGSSYAAAAAAMAGYAATAAAMLSAAPSTLPAPKVLSRPASNSSLHSGGGGGGGGGPAAHSSKVPAPNAAPAIEVFLGSGAQGGGKSRGRGRSGGGRGGGRGS
jgi:regulator of nonsense transcripts 3